MRSFILLILFAACSEPVPTLEVIEVPLLDAEGIFQVAGTDPERPRLRYRDGQISRNDTCAIKLKNKLNPAIPPMYVNGAPIGFC